MTSPRDTLPLAADQRASCLPVSLTHEFLNCKKSRERLPAYITAAASGSVSQIVKHEKRLPAFTFINKVIVIILI